MKRILHLTRTVAVVACAVGAAQIACAQTTWTGGGGADTNWSNAGNWSFGAVPNAADAVVFNDPGAALAVSNINNVADVGITFLGTVASLQYANTNGFHTTLINPGQTLSVGGLIAGTEIDSGINQVINATITGPDATLNVSGSLIVRQGSQTGGGTQRATLDMSGLGTLVANVGSVTVGRQGTVTRETGTLYLANTNAITASSEIDLAYNNSNPGGANYIYLGQTNAIFANAVQNGRRKSSGSLLFRPGLNNPSALFRHSDGMSRINAWNIGDNSAESTTTGSGSTGVADFTGGSVDAQVATMQVGRSKNGTGTSGATGGGTGTLTFGAGVIDINTLELGYQGGANVASGVGTVNVNGTGTLVVNTSLRLGFTSGSSGAANTRGVLNINGGTVRALSITTGSGSLNNTVAMNGGSLIVTNTAGPGINTFSLADATLTVPAYIEGPAVIVTNLTLGGSTNIINISAVPTVAGYPAQFAIVKYSGAIGGVAFNVGRGAMPPSSPAFTGYISNNTANSSIDLVVTGGPVPARSISWRGATDGNWDTATLNWFFGGLTAYNQKDFVRFDDTASGVTAVNLTMPLTPSSITVSNITKAYTFSGPGNISGSLGLTKQGSGMLTIANDGVNDFTGAIEIEGGALRFNHSFDASVSNVISGAGTLTQAGLATLVLYGANTLEGPVTVTQGTLRAGNNAALGTTNGATTIASGASLDIGANTINLGQEPIIASGDGVFGGGAVVNSSGNNNFVGPNLARLTLAGHTRIGGSGRWDLRSPAGTSADPALASLSTGGNAYNLTKVGANTVNLVAVTVDPALANIAINEGLLSFEGNTTSAGNPAGTLTIASLATLRFYALTNILDKNIVIQDGGIVANANGANTIIGPMTLNGNGTTFDIGGTSMTLSNNISGTALLNKIGNGRLILAGSATHTGGTVINAGTLELRGTHNGALTNQGLAVISGTGTNIGTVDAIGPIVPGASNVVGTLTTGPLILEYGASLAYDLTSDNTPGASDLIVVNGDLTVNLNTIAINPMGLLQKATYRLFTYTGNLIWNADIYIPDQVGYSFTWNTNTPGQVNLVVTARPPVWNGGSTVGSFWSDTANWDGASITFGSVLYFAGNTRLNNINDTTGNIYGDTVFTADAGPFTLNGNPLTLGGNIVNLSANTQTVNMGLDFNANYTFNGSSNTLVIGGGVTNTANLTTLTLAGTGIISNRLSSADVNAMTNTLLLNTASAHWTLMDNPSSTPVSIPVQLDIQAGTLNFGAGASAPVLTSTTQRGAPQDQRVGNISGTIATLNIVNGTLTTMARLNTGTAGGATGIVNQVGGVFNLGDQFQGANGSATAASAVNVSGGTMNIGSSTNPGSVFFVASRGPGSLTVSGAGVLNCGTLDVSHSINSSIPGTVNLDGGTLSATRVSTATANSGAATTGSTATFNFNGGTLKARASSATFFQGRTSGPAVPITAFVKAGGAVIDTDTNAISILEPLLHDTELGATPDGGLTKAGTGTLTLTAANTYTGDTLVNDGTLVVNGTLAATAVTVASGGTLAGTGSMGSNATISVGGTIAPGNPAAIGTLTIASNVVLRGTVSVEVNRAAGAVTNDLLRAATIDLGGALVVTNTGPALASGDSFTLFSGVLSGSINPSTLPVLSPGLSWDTSALNTLGRISVIGSPVPPSIAASGISGGSFNLAGSGGTPGGTYYVLASTDVALPLSSWSRVATNAFDSSGNFSAAIAVNPAADKTFYLLQLP